jgi:hypothetical protein
MKFLVAMILTALLAFVSGLFLPWWGIALVAWLVALFIPQRPVGAFFSGLAGAFLMWTILAWWIDMKNDSVLSHRMAEVLPFGGNTILLITVPGLLVGGLVSGLAALSGCYLRLSPRRR